MRFNLENLVRENIKAMKPYSSARHEFSGTASVFMDANENPYGSALPDNFNRYPDPLQRQVKEKLSQIKGVLSQNIFLGNGSDEAIDLLIRIFCEPGRNNVLIFPPTYGMYEVCAHVNNVQVKEISLTPAFQLDMEAIEQSVDTGTKIIFICSPNNPTGNSIERNDIEIILNNFDGPVVLDEAYINYSSQRSFIPELTEYPNLIVMQTLSKAWGLAGLRLGMLFASPPVIDLLNKIKYPYNINTATQHLVLQALDKREWMNEHIATTVKERELLKENLSRLDFTLAVYPSDANFLLVKMQNANTIYNFLCSKGIIVRNRSNINLCEDCLRITIGTLEENQKLLTVLKEYKPK
ncbi:MAG: histidinol-phosphate transaminase [Chitinophagaceae bacterium]|nr:histidinol-phosphate transaminase [Chitinophagaceae bacterium]